MPQLLVSISLPYALRLRDDDYPGASADSIQIREVLLPDGSGARTFAQAVFRHPESADRDEKLRLRSRDARELLRRTNYLLRWYRAVSFQTEVIELTRAQASPFDFQLVGEGEQEGWTGALAFEASGLSAPLLSVDELSDAVRTGVDGGGEPEVATLFLFDAERAIQEGRFREAVLFCWSTIDAVFNRKYDLLVNEALAQEWADAREFFTGVDFGLRNKMSAVMHLVANRSLFREPDGLWRDLSESYRKRNDIIHRGENATEDEAGLALGVARRIIDVMDALKISPELK